MIPDWETNCVYFSRLLGEQYSDLLDRLTQVLRTQEVEVRFLDGTKDIWARDYCPVQVEVKRFLKFRYDPDYLKGKYRHLVTGDEVIEQLRDLGTIQKSETVLDGGNVVTSGSMVILTDKVFQENPRRRRRELQQELAGLLGVEGCIIIPTEPLDYIGHADGMVRFLTENLVVVNDYTGMDRSYRRRLHRALVRHGLEIIPCPSWVSDVTRKGIASAVGNYVNFLRVGNLVILPAYEDRRDEDACRALEHADPRLTIVPVQCRSLAEEGGVLQCVSWIIKL